jgi:hypothetical protein
VGKGTWLRTALCTAGPTFSRTSLPLMRLEMMSTCSRARALTIRRALDETVVCLRAPRK